MPPSRPNVLVITTHDSGRMFGCYGNPTVHTPRIDRLAHDGVLFENMNATCPICSPSRGALLTGRYPLANGLVGLAGGCWNWEMNDYHQHLSHLLRDAGYQTALFGLQHETVHIDRMGFEQITPREKKSAVQVAGDVSEFLRGDPDGPFYLQVGFFETHTSYDYAGCEPDDENGVWIPPFATTHSWPGWANLLNRFGGDPEFARQHVAELQGALHRVDCAVGTILDALSDAGLDRNTIVLFNTDHGAELPGAKWTMYDPGLGVAFIMRWPAGGVAGGRRCPWMLSNVDFVPTLFDLLELDPPRNLQGVSFARGCREYVEDIASSPRDVAFGNWVDGLNFSARTDRYKLIRNLVPVDSTGRECPDYELYDLSIDPLEITDVAREPVYAEAREGMKAHLEGWLTEMDDPAVHGPIEGEEHEEMIANYRARYEARH